MKDKKSKYLTKLILLLFSLLVVFCFFACGGEENTVLEEKESSQIISDEISISSEEPVIEYSFTNEEAVELIRKDKLVTEIFVCNSLCNKKTIEYHDPVNKDFLEFTAIEELMNSVYASENIEKEFFVNYPFSEIPSVISAEGKTKVFYHPQSGYTDFADESTIRVAEVGIDTQREIYAKTLSGREIKFEVVFENGNWLLTKGIYLINPPIETEFDKAFPEYSAGSLKTLSGDILVIEMFITDKETDITIEEETAFHNKIVSALDSLSQKGKEYGMNAKFQYAQPLYFDHENVLDNRVLDFDIMVAETGFVTLKNFAEANCNVNDYDGYFLAVYIDKEIETSVGVNDNTKETEIYYGERILLGKNCSEYEIETSVLKLAGAYGYSDERLDKYTESLFKTYFPNEIMHSNKSDSVISPITAYSCGMIKELKNIYRIFIPTKQ